jgi:type I restriction enzyme S subunit
MITEAAVACGTRTVSAGTILLVVRSMILAREVPLTVIKRRMAFNQDIKAVLPKPGINPQFLFAWLMAKRPDILGIVDEAGHGTKRIQTDRLLALPIHLPSIERQNRIASILSAYDDLIEVNRRRIAILEEMARRLFEEWFVHLRFPGYESSDGNDLPEGWAFGSVGDLLTLHRGYDLATAERCAGDIPVMTGSGRNGSHNAYKTLGPGVVTGRSGTVGQVFLIHENFWPLNTALYVSDYKRAKPGYAVFLLRSLKLAAHAGGAAVPTLNRNHVHALPALLPPTILMDRFEEIAMPMLRQIRTIERLNETLTSARDLLLPRLLSGELSVVAASEPETLLAAAE